jgi:hypothetical protein
MNRPSVAHANMTRRLITLTGIAVLTGISCVTTGASASDNLEPTLTRLMAILPGEFDSAQQMRAEQATNTPPESVHSHVYRSFIRIEAPAIGKNVLVSTVRYGGRDGQFDNYEFQVWALSVDSKKGAVEMKPHRFKTPEQYVANNRNADAFKDLATSELIPAHGAAGCPVYWTANGDALRGTTHPPCNSLSETMGVVLAWEWAYSLDESGAWINFAGRDNAGEVVNGRTDQMPWRLDKLDYVPRQYPH